MSDLPDMKIKAIPSYPADILGGDGIEANKVNGHVVIDLAHGEFATQTAIPTSPTNTVLTYDTATSSYVNIPTSLLGGAVAGISDAPINSILYGRRNAAWEAVPASPDISGLAPKNSPVFTGNPTAPTASPGDNDTSVATTAFVTNAVAGGVASGSSFLQAGTGAVTRTMQDKARDIVSVKDFGAVGDGIANDGPAIQAAVTYALANSKSVYIPGGVYRSNIQITGSGADVNIRGAGQSVSRVVFTAPTGGFAFTMDAQSTGVRPDQFNISDLTIEANADITSPAIYAIWTPYQPNAQGQLWIENLSISRKADGTGSFTTGINLSNCIGGMIRSVAILGDDARISIIGIDLYQCVEIICQSVKVNRYKQGVRIGKGSTFQTEGILLTDCMFYDVYYGVNVVDQAIHINVVGTHININGPFAEFGISMTDVSQATISGCLIYVGGSAPDPVGQDGIRIANRSGNTVCNNQLVAATSANARYGILLISNTSFNNISGNSISVFSGAAVRIIDGSATSNMLLNNNFYNCADTIADAGTATYRSGNISIPSLGNAIAIDNLRWGPNIGDFSSGQISTNAQWGGYLRGHPGTNADLALADSDGVVALTVEQGAVGIKAYAKASLPLATLRNAGCGLIYVTDDVGGSVLAFSDGGSWRRVTDRAVIA